MSSRPHTPAQWRNCIVGTGEERPENLRPNPKNWRIHPDYQRDALEGVLDEVGLVQHVIVNKRTGHLVDGHLRVTLASQRGESTIPVVYVDLSPEDELKILATLDPLAAMAEADGKALAEILADLETESEALGKMLEEMAEEVAFEDEAGSPEDPGAEIDRAEELREKWGVERGQIWQVGRHRVMCGDSTSAEDVAALLDGAKPLLMVTDPPYGVEYNPQWRQDAADAGHLSYGACAVGQVAGDDRADWTDAWELFPGNVMYTWSPGGDHVLVTGAAIQGAGFDIRAMLVWRKAHFAISRGHYHYQHEPVWYAVRKGAQASWRGDRAQSSVWDINHTKNATGHGTEKPLECMARPIRNHDAPEVYDPFLGSGTTAVAAEQLNRTCYGMEIEPKYVAVTLQRLADMGLEPKLS